ncbi:MAG: hypothetical protein ACLQG3_11735 [Terracidiphilus sp.]
MVEKNESMRDGLLARLPQPENLAAYREETASLLAKHERAVRWDKITTNIVSLIFGLLLGVSLSLHPSRSLDALVLYRLQLSAAFLFIFWAIYGVHIRIYSSQVATLKEVKQVQLQVLELQASLKTTRENQP